MNRIQNCFQNLKQKNRKGLIPYITAGDPHPDWTVPLLHGLVAAGADMIEIGVPFSDPMADGPSIQKAIERALMHQVNLTDIFSMIKEFRQQDQHTPIVLMGYLNPIEQMGYEKFAQQAAAVGVDGVLTVDLPPEEASTLKQALDKHQVDPIFLIAPTTRPERIRLIDEAGSGYLYYVSFKGVTGADRLNALDVADKMKEIRQLSDLPLCVGFGIRDANTALQVAPSADAVIIGSALIDCIAKQLAAKNLQAPVAAEAWSFEDFRTLLDVVKSIRVALDN